ncbi:MAG: AAA domain-containing protein, partial [Candidatus Pacebacteria bacterium]|nr:AAA domain-containing protein [Candidatus Paceibacterota bacterium]
STEISGLTDKPEKQEETVQTILKQHFRPEFLNRIDEIVIFQPLSKQNIEQVVELQLAELQTRLNSKNITLDVTAEAKSYLAKIGYDPVFGARPLKRLLQTSIMDPLASKLLAGEIKEGQSIKVSEKNSTITFS